MVRLTFSLLRHSGRRLLSAGLAILIGAAFVAATLIAGDVLERASVQALSAEFGDADLVVDGPDLDPDVATTIDELPGVASSQAVLSVFVQVEGGGTSNFLQITPAATDPALTGVDIVAGNGAPGPGQLVLPESLADRLGVEVGDEVPIRRSVRRDDGDEDVSWDEVVDRVEVSGLLRPAPLGLAGLSSAIGEPDQVVDWAVDDRTEEQTRFDRVLLRLAPETSAAEVTEQVSALRDDLRVSTREDYADARAQELTGGANVLTALGLAFGAVALLVAGLVIANTFSVVVAQRTRTLALLRCVGANRRQLRRSVRLEALLLATIASSLGIGVGLGLAQATLSVLAATGGAGLPSVIAPSPSVFLIPLLAGLTVTTLAALVPARAASRVAPLAAMRPTGTAQDARAVGRGRKAVSALLIVGGGAFLTIGAVLGGAGEVALGLLVGVLGGGTSFIGVLLSAVVWVPRLLRLLAAVLVRRGGATAALAAANSLRNPRRTAATSTALLIGVTLVAMMASGASIARTSFDQEFDRAFPVDAQVSPGAMGEEPDTLPTERIDALRAIDGVVAATGTGQVTLQLEAPDQTAVLDVTVIDRDAARAVVRDERALDGFDDALLIPEHLADSLGLTGALAATPIDRQGQPLDGGGEVGVQTRDGSGTEVLLTRSGADRLGVDVPTTGAWIRFAERAEVEAVVGDIQQAVSEDGLLVQSDAAEREVFDQIVSTMLRVVTGLLGVAVVIALVGVANTLSLSVIERGRESATLRAIGLTRRQLRATLAIEAMLIAGVGAVAGALLGTLYGWVGSSTVLGELSDGVPLAVPWLQLAALVGFSLLAGVIASVLPGRRAARTSPVAALAAE